jgi:aromatic ring-cleaving dioxygenase
MSPLSTSLIASWHAHVYFDASSRSAALAHPMWSYQLAFRPDNFAQVVSWLALNHGDLDVFVHPNTGDELRDHRDAAIWFGSSKVLNLAALAG